MAGQPQVVLGLLLGKACGHTHLDTPHLVGFLWTSDKPVVETST
jgi:hypothetical protein